MGTLRNTKNWGNSEVPKEYMEPNELLSAEEARVLACLVEKELTTPDYYPLTLNALVAACNQKSSRYPVVNYDNGTVEAAIASLKQKGYVRVVSGAEHRVPKYKHDMHFMLRLNPAQAAVLTVLMLRGAQTVEEIRGRTDRMYDFSSLEEVSDVLRDLKDHAGRVLVAELERLPGTKESRFVHLLSGEPDTESLQAAVGRAAAPTSAGDIAELRAEVDALRETVKTLQEEFARFRQQFE